MPRDDETVPFVMIFQARSGSTYLTELLNSHPRIYTRQEAFTRMIKRGKKQGWSVSETSRRQLEWADTYYRAPPNSDVYAWGFKTKFQDILDHEGFAHLIHEHEVRVLVLLRRNLVKSVVSLLNAIQLNKRTGDWNARGKREDLSPFAVDPEKFDKWLRGYEQGAAATRSYVAAHGFPHLEIQYEDLLTAYRPTLERICSFLQVPYVPMQTAIRKNTSDDLRDVVLNFDELKSHYADTPYSPMFDEVLAPSSA